MTLASGNQPRPDMDAPVVQTKGFADMSFKVPPGPVASLYRLDDFRTAQAPEPEIDGTQVWGEILAAAQLFGKLREAGLSVRFDVDDPTLPPRVRITDLQGRTIKEIPPEIACDPVALEAEALSPAG
ncbi:MAG: hypothetical protein QOG68_858 [Solirubrobacteraceae bacterium]|jgi:hypothetical protein|nr:hypothetical protein [Solirubrobacteraceae bacterium]MEA2146333.1 hypothetical protein [Solirubrobacteraceae bacterium]